MRRLGVPSHERLAGMSVAALVAWLVRAYWKVQVVDGVTLVQYQSRATTRTTYGGAGLETLRRLRALQDAGRLTATEDTSGKDLEDVWYRVNSPTAPRKNDRVRKARIAFDKALAELHEAYSEMAAECLEMARE